MDKQTICKYFSYVEPKRRYQYGLLQIPIPQTNVKYYCILVVMQLTVFDFLDILMVELRINNFILESVITQFQCIQYITC